jgi:hypothetical protein
MTKFSDDSVQYAFEQLHDAPWWERVAEPSQPPRVGQLVSAYFSVAEEVPNALWIEKVTADQQRIDGTLKPLSAGVPSLSAVPSAALGRRDADEFWLLQRARKRVGLVLSDGPRRVALPYYPAAVTADRPGYSQAFLARVRAAKLPSLFWDSLPLADSFGGSAVLRLDHPRSFSATDPTVETLPWALSAAALSLVRAWYAWAILAQPLAGTLLSELLELLPEPADE